MRILVGTLAVLVLVGAGVGGTLGTQRLIDNDSRNEPVYVYVDRTPAPQEIEIRKAFQELLDDYNARRWEDVLTDFASSCRPAPSADVLGAGFATKTARDPTWRFELRQFRVIEVHDKAAVVDDEVVLIDKEGTAAYGPDYGRQPLVTRFYFEDGQWRAC